MDVTVLVLIWFVALVAIGFYGWREGLRAEREARGEALEAFLRAVVDFGPEISRAFDGFALSVEEAAAHLRRFFVAADEDVAKSVVWGEDSE